MKIKLSDYIAKFLKNRGIYHAFGITGGSSIHILHSLHNNGIEVICNHHEQSCAFAADAYARINGMGVAMSTSGPGATNLITGISGAYFDSVPCLFITGQVVKSRFKGNTGVRQMGFQETDILSMIRPVTKYSKQILNAKDIRYELEKAWFIARNGRKGPVLLDIPDDIQREEVDPETLVGWHYNTPEEIYALSSGQEVSEEQINKTVDLIKAAKRPALIYGWGVRLSQAEQELKELIEKLGIPVCPSWGGMDLIPDDNTLKVGGIGINGSRAGNFTVQNADLLLVIGARLSTRETGNPLSSFARAAKIIMVDIDSSELGKFPHFGKNIDLPIQSDAKVFIKKLLNKLNSTQHEKLKIGDWKAKISEWRRKYDPDYQFVSEYDPIDPYIFVDKLSRNVKEGAVIVCDTGCAIAWMMQGFKFKKDQRFFHDFNNTAMSWALPASIGAHFASGKEIICVIGDGSFAMNVQEIYTIMHHRLPIKIFLLNNSGYSMVRQTCDEWFNKEYIAVGRESMSFPNYELLARSCNIWYEKIEKNNQLNGVIARTLRKNGPVLCNIIIPEECKVWPKNKFGRPIEDAEPLLDRNEFKNNMIIEPYDGWDKI